MGTNFHQSKSKRNLVAEEVPRFASHETRSSSNRIYTMRGSHQLLSGSLCLISTYSPNIGIAKVAPISNARELMSTGGSSARNTSISSLLAGNHKPRLRLDKIEDKSISIEFVENHYLLEHGQIAANVGASDFDVNEPTMGVGGVSSISGLTVGT